MTKPAIATALIFILSACGGSEKKADEPSPVEPEAPSSAGVLTVAPFVLTISGTQPDGSKDVRVIRGSADGVISGEKDGETREILKVTADGTFTALDAGGPVIKLGADGTLSMNGETLPSARIGDDGTIYRDDQPMLKIEGGKVVDLVGDLLVSRVTMNGEVTSEVRFEMTIEGGDEVRKLVAAILVMQMSAGAASSAPVEESAPEAAPAPTP